MSVKSAALLATTAALVMSSAPLAPRDFRIDAGHSDVSFSIGFLGRAVKGRFDNVQGTIVYTPASDGGPGRSGITVVIETNTINTGSKHRDEHLRTSDFFDVQQFPRIVFQSKSIRRIRDGFVMSGPLTMHGVTRTIDIPFRQTAKQPVQDPHGSNLIAFTGSVRIARKDFGILGGSKYNDWFDKLRSATVADTVDVDIDIEGWATDFARDHKYDAALKRIAADGVASIVSATREKFARDPNAMAGSEWEFSQLGAALMANGRAADAIEILKLETEMFPKSSSARSGLAVAYETAAQPQAAIKLVNEALALDPFDTRALELKRRLGG